MTFQVVLSYHPGILSFGCRENQVLEIASCSVLYVEIFQSKGHTSRVACTKGTGQTLCTARTVSRSQDARLGWFLKRKTATAKSRHSKQIHIDSH